MTDAINIAIAGLGTVGAGTVAILQKQMTLLSARCGKTLALKAVSARDKSKDRGIALDDSVIWVEDATQLAAMEDVDMVVELIGGSDGVAKMLVEAALKNGKHVVTANKALIAHHGVALAQLAEENKVVLAYEAAVAGGIPIISTMRDGVAANHIDRVMGILNGTGNYILTTMQKTGRAFDDVLKEAQDLGYAEADPSFDIDGIDTAHKLAILTSLAYGTPVTIDGMHIEGIRNVSANDIRYAAELGYVIKLLGITEEWGEGVLQRVYPAMVPAGSPIGVIDGAFNAVQIDGSDVGRLLLEGQGAGAGPTASSVVSDIVQIARGVTYPPFTIPSSHLSDKPMVAMDAYEARYYMRLKVRDEAGVLADITAICAKEAISVESMIQHPVASDDDDAHIVITTHKTKESSMQNALQQMAELTSITKRPHMIRMEDV